MADKHWHAVYTASRAEKKVRERLDAAGIECFLPVQAVVRQWAHRKARVVVPVIPGLLFVRVERKDRVPVLETQSVVAFLKLRGEREPATIPDDQMERFRFLLDFSEEAVEMVNEHIAVGDRIRVVKGALKGLEGELVRFRGETKVAVRIDLLGCALADIPASFVERLDAPPKL